ncbi:MAG: LytTR family transcriptional regulator DNA-binding domain-containing protein [Bacteroidia bacterium]|nr:LytTR family transcriptional regulator DNA-binding domain-containing protein [Bacteroidia bacterium]
MITSFLKQPFPYSENRAGRIRVSLFTGFFIFLFLFIFRPFQLHRFETLEIAKITAGYGLITCVMVLLNAFYFTRLFPRFFSESHWTVGREILYIMWIIFTIGIANALYSVWIFRDNISIQYLVSFQVFTLLVALLPVSINVMVIQLVLTRRNLRQAREISGHMHHKKRLDAIPDAMVSLRSENKKEELTLPARDLLYISSADNYIEVHYLENGKEQRRLLRGTLKNAREDLQKFTAFYRCHRTWIVNLDRVKSVTGNSQGYRLVLDGTDTVVPVSRNLNEELNTRLAK